MFDVCKLYSDLLTPSGERYMICGDEDGGDIYPLRHGSVFLAIWCDNVSFGRGRFFLKRTTTMEGIFYILHGDDA